MLFSSKLELTGTDIATASMQSGQDLQARATKSKIVAASSLVTNDLIR